MIFISDKFSLHLTECLTNSGLHVKERASPELSPSLPWCAILFATVRRVTMSQRIREERDSCCVS